MRGGDFSFPSKFIIYKRLPLNRQPLFYFKKEMIFMRRIFRTIRQVYSLAEEA